MQFEFRLDSPGPPSVPAHPEPPKPPTPDPRIEVHQKTLDTLENSLRELRERFMTVHDQLHGLLRRFDTLERFTRQGTSGSSSQSNPSSADYLGSVVRDEILQEIAQLRLEIDQRLLGLAPQAKADMSAYAPLAVVKQIALNFQTSVDDFDQQIVTIKDFLKNLVSRNDLEAMMDRLTAPTAKPGGETAGGRIRCLLCGRAAGSVTGMITESDVARMLGTPPQSRVRGSTGDSYVLAYGKETVGRRMAKKSPARNAIPLPPINPPVKVSV
jgi:hypothetical protein